MKKINYALLIAGAISATPALADEAELRARIDKLSADIIHDSRHSEQFARGLSFNEKTVIPMETEASQFTVDLMDKMGGFNADVRAGYQDDAKTGHFPRGSGWKDKSTPKSRAKVSETMQKPQKRRN